MSADEGSDRTVVRTYVPAYQKAAWREHADELDMSQSEFVRTMVQAGRSGFEPPESSSRSDYLSGNPAQPPSPDATPGGDGLEDRVLEILSDGDRYDWDELLEELTGDIERRLDETLQGLQASGRVRYSGRHGGYVLDR